MNSALTCRHLVLQYCHVSEVPWPIITASGLDDWIYWQFLLQSIVIIVIYKNSQSIFSRTILPWLSRARSILFLVLQLTSLFFFVILDCKAIGTAATPGLLRQPRVIVEKQMECRLAGETEVLGENLPQRHFCPTSLLLWMIWFWFSSNSLLIYEQILIYDCTGCRIQ
jgi:hypothetical protein